jgi:hypothetical protein
MIEQMFHLWSPDAAFSNGYNLFQLKLLTPAAKI